MQPLQTDHRQRLQPRHQEPGQPSRSAGLPLVFAGVNPIVLTEADTSTRYVIPKLRAAGWDDSPHSFSQEHSFTDGRIILIGTKVKRKEKKRADFLLQLTRDFTIAVVEVKSEDRPAGEGLQQAKVYAEMVLHGDRVYAANQGVDALLPIMRQTWDQVISMDK